MVGTQDDWSRRKLTAFVRKWSIVHVDVSVSVPLLRGPRRIRARVCKTLLHVIAAFCLNFEILFNKSKNALVIQA